MVLLEDLWVFSKAGVPIVDFCKEGSINKSLLGCAISVIESYCEKVTGCKLNAFNLKSLKFSLIPCLDNNIVLVAKSSLNAKPKDIQNMCKIIADLFEEMFSIEQISNWDGDLSMFDKFQTKIDIYFRMGDL